MPSRGAEQQRWTATLDSFRNIYVTFLWVHELWWETDIRFWQKRLKSFRGSGLGTKTLVFNFIVSNFWENDWTIFKERSCTSPVFVQLNALQDVYVPPPGVCLALQWQLVSSEHDLLLCYWPCVFSSTIPFSNWNKRMGFIGYSFGRGWSLCKLAVMSLFRWVFYQPGALQCWNVFSGM